MINGEVWEGEDMSVDAPRCNEEFHQDFADVQGQQEE